MSSIIEELNENQRIAVTRAAEMSLRIVAGPGTGKTKTLVARFLALTLGNSLPADRVLALTFTTKAAEEMVERASQLYQQNKLTLNQPWISTFHSFCFRILYGHEDTETNKHNSPLTELERLKLRQDLSREILLLPDLAESYPHLDFADHPALFDAAYLAIERLRDSYCTPEELLAKLPPVGSANEEGYRRDIMGFTAELYRCYREKLEEMKRLDFPEMVYRAYYRLKDNPDLCQTYRERFHHILGDEFQDTSRGQLQLLKLLSPDLSRVTVVGDRKQSIYGWRNARPENFDDPHLVGAIQVPLNLNYRSYQEILDIAARVILPLADSQLFLPEELTITANNKSGPEGCVTLACPEDSVSKEEGLKAEAHFIASEIKKLKETQPDKTIALLLRSVRIQSRPYEEIFRAEGIEYVTWGAGGFYDRQEVKDLIAILRLVENPSDGQAFYRLAPSPLFKLEQALLYELALKARTVTKEREWNFEAGIEELAEVPQELRELQIFIAECRREAAQLTPALLVEWILSGERYSQYFESRTVGERERVEANLSKLMKLATAFEKAQPEAATLKDMVEYFNLWIEFGLPEQEELLVPEDPKPGVVQVMTVHLSKGLEFDSVFVAGIKPSQYRVETRLFSYEPDLEHEFEGGFAILKYQGEDGRVDGSNLARYKEIQKKRWLAEERFVYYVAMTRAKKKLSLTTAYSEQVIREMKGRAANFLFSELTSWVEEEESISKGYRLHKFAQ